MIRSINFIFLLLFSFNFLNAQELDFKVTVQTQSSIKSVVNGASFFSDLEKKITDLLNTTKWTEDEYLDTEKIKGNIQITITEAVGGVSFKAELVLQTERPVFNSIYSSPMISIIDKNITFNYTDLQPLTKTTNTFYDNLSSIISFYAFYTIGKDYDSYSINGGDIYFARCQDVLSSLSSGYFNDEGWKNDGGGKRNRYWLLENVLNPRMRQYRQAYYEYHRLSLDKMYDEPEKSRAVMLSALTSIGQANIEYPNTFLVQMFGDAKKDEIIEIFKLGDKGQKTKVKSIMTGMDATKSSKYDVLN